MPKKADKKQKSKKQGVAEPGHLAARSARETPVRAALASKSYYLKSIFDPINFPGSKVPDAISVPSATSQCRMTVQVTVNGQGVAGIWVIPAMLSASNGYQITATTATTSALTWGATASKTYYSSCSATFQARRLVSAGLYFEYQGSPINRKGRAVINFETPLGNVSAPTVVSNMLYETYSEDLNVAKKAYGMVRYIPQDATWLQYQSIGTGVGAFGIVIDGATSGDVVEFTLVENFEFIPLNATLNLITPTPSISDPIELSLAANVISTNDDFPVLQSKTDSREGLGAANAFRVHAPNETMHTGREPTMFESFLSGISKALPVVRDVVGTGVGVASTLAPLLF